jgi:hypothetical protein
VDTSIVPVNNAEHIEKENNLQVEPKPNSYKVGDTTGLGDVIEFIYHSNSNFLIYRNTAGFVSYMLRGDFRKYEPAFVEFRKLVIEAERLLRGAYRRDFSNLIAACLRAALLSADGEDLVAHFEPLRKFLEERGPIEYVYGYGPGFIIYFNKRQIINYEYRELPNRLIPAIAEFHRLQHIAKTSLQQADKNEVSSILGTELASAFRSSEDSDSLSCFVSSKEFITNRSEAILRSRYIRSSTLSSNLYCS